MANVTMSIEDSLLKEARKIAVEHDTTLSEMYRNYLTELVRKEEARRSFAARELDDLFGQSRASSAGKSWTRDELHER